MDGEEESKRGMEKMDQRPRQSNDTKPGATDTRGRMMGSKE
jgi:hypothetical protein